MKPLRPGKARSALVENLRELLADPNDPSPAELNTSLPHEAIERTAAVLGGAIESALDDMGYRDKFGMSFFWRLANENTWRMIRALKASGQLEKIK